MKKRFLAALSFACIAATIFCVKDYKPVLTKMTEDYWHKIFEGKMEDAYAMLSQEAKNTTDLEQFAKEQSLVNLKIKDMDELYQAFASQCELEIVSVDAAGRKASVDVLLIVPDLSLAEKDLESTDPADTAREQIAGQVIDAVKKQLMPTEQIAVVMTWVREGKDWKLESSE